MKFSKKVLPMVLAMAMVPAMSMTAFASNASTPTTASTTVDISKHTFDAYQIFTGTLVEGTNTLSDVKWGEGVNSTDLLKALKAATTFSDGVDFSKCSTAADVADIVGKWSDNSNDAKTFAKLVAANLTDVKTVGTESGKATLPKAGYYLIVDATDVSSKDDASNLSLLEVSKAETVTVRNKTSKTTLEKKVKDVNDSVSDSETTWQDSADYDIGDHIPYQLTATLGDLENYDTYKLVFHDEMTHLTLDQNCEYSGHALKVKVGDRELKTNEYDLNVNQNQDAFDITIADVKTFGGAEGVHVTVEYYAILGDDAVIGATGNPNTSYLEYSNNPNKDGLGKTAPDKNIVFTYSVIANKKDGEGNPLAGAAFELWKKDTDGKWNSVKVIGATKTNDSNTGKDVYTQTETEKNNKIFEFKGIDDGEYKLSEVVTPSGYNSISDITFTVIAGHDILADNPQLTSLTAGELFKAQTESGKLTGAVTADIVNKSGSQLPETGGIGTTIFYVVGVILMLGAGVLLVTKKRMSTNR